MNKLYELCNNQIYTTKDRIGVNFQIKFDEEKEVRRNDVNQLYFNVIDTLLDREKIEDLYIIRNFIRTNDRDGEITKKIDRIVDGIANGK